MVKFSLNVICDLLHILKDYYDQQAANPEKHFRASLEFQMEFQDGVSVLTACI